MRKKEILNDLLLILAGNAILSIGVGMFVLPSNILSGGVAGISVALQPFLHIDPNVMINILTIGLFLIGSFLLGKKFAINTLLSTIFYPLFVTVISAHVTEQVTDSPLLASIYAGVFVGVGVGLVFRSGSSTGGMDIPPLILYKCFRIPVSVSLYVFDVCILLLQVPYQKAEKILYGIVFVMLSAIALDKTMMIGTTQTEVKIVSGKSEEIRDAILKQLDRGVTLLNAEGGYLHDKSQMIFSVISNRELFKLEKIVHGIDPASFMVVTRVSEVKGRGFSMDKNAL